MAWRKRRGVPMAIKKEYMLAITTAAFTIILFSWFVLCAGKLTAFFILWTAMLLTFSFMAMLVDIRKRCIPNKLVLGMFTGWLLLTAPKLLLDTQAGIPILTDSVIGALIGGGVFLSVYLLSRRGLGGGDVKFMAAAGLYLGFGGTLPAILYGTVLAALSGLILIALKRIKRKDTIPLAPFLFAGIMITVFTT